MKPKFCITIGRELGSGGREVGKKLSEKLNIPFYDKKLITLASKESGISPEFFEKADEKPSSKFFSSLFGLNFSSMFMPNTSASSVLDGNELFKIQSDVVREVAEQGSAVFVGRCADFILRDNPNLISIFITAPLEERCERVRTSGLINGIENFSNEQLVELLEKEDARRSEYYNYYTYKTWGAASSYNLCLDSKLLGVDGCVEIILGILGAE